MNKIETIKDITFHYTKENMVKDLIKLIPFVKNDYVLDAGSGKNKVWFNNIPQFCKKEEYELEDGIDFIETLESKKFDWIIGNPPFHLGWAFLDKASKLSNKGIAFLGNLNFLNSTVLPNRMELLRERGFYLNKIHIVQDKRWFGRYFFVIFTKNPEDFISWNKQNY